MKKYHLRKLLERIYGKEMISDKFHKSTNNYKLKKNKQTSQIPYQWTTIHFKTYPRLEKIPLSKVKADTKLAKILKKRRSLRQFLNKPLSKKELSYILYISGGLILLGKTFNQSRRPYPSAGARFPLELYPLIFNCKSLSKGLYHYNVKENSLELLLKKDLSRWFYKATGREEWTKNIAVAFIISSVLDRSRIKYGDRGYRFVLIEAGHLGQNICLIATEMGLGTCPIGGFIDADMNKLLDIDLQKEYVLYIIAVGKI